MLEHALKGEEGLVYLVPVELTLLAVPQQSDHGSCSWISWKINTRSGASTAQSPAGKPQTVLLLEHQGPCSPDCCSFFGAELAPGEAGRVQLTVSCVGGCFSGYEMREMITYSVKGPREMHYLPPCLLMVFSLELSAALAAMINLQYPWGRQQWIWEPRGGLCYCTDFLLLSKSFCI